MSDEQFDVVGVTLTPDGVQPISRTVAQAGRLAYGLALASGDGVAIADVYRRSMTDGGVDAAVLQQALFLVVAGVVRPLLADSQGAAEHLERFRECLREFDDMLDD